MRYCKPTLLLLLLLPLASCKDRTASMKAETIFSIPIGVMRDEINMFSRKNFLYNDNSSLTITPLGSYYIADRSSRKILYYTNYGKLNYTIYDPDFRFDSDKQKSKYLDKTWNFGEISEIAASLDKLYVTSTLSLPKRATGAGGTESTELADAAGKAVPVDLYAQVILTFDDKGDYLYQLGPEGRKSGPFRNRVMKLFIDSQDRLFVVAQLSKAYAIYQFSPTGQLLSQFELSVAKTILANSSFHRAATGSTDSDGRSFYEITSPNFSHDGKRLFFELYHYTTKINNATSKTRQLNTYSYDIYSIRTDTPLRSLKKNFSVRKFNTERQDTKQIYGEQLLGTTSNDLLVFLQTYPNGKNIVVYYDMKGNREYIVTIDVEQQVPYELYLAPNGLISALNFYEDRVRVTWWRTDKLFGKELSF